MVGVQYLSGVKNVMISLDKKMYFLSDMEGGKNILFTFFILPGNFRLFR